MNLRALAWPALIVSMLGANMAIVAVTVVASRRDEGATITPGYDERALRWDEHREAGASGTKISSSSMKRAREGVAGHSMRTV